MKDRVTLSWEKFAKTGSVDAYLEYHSQVVNMMKDMRGLTNERSHDDGNSDKTAGDLGKG